jgi:hypothetical protein
MSEHEEEAKRPSHKPSATTIAEAPRPKGQSHKPRPLAPGQAPKPKKSTRVAPTLHPSTESAEAGKASVALAAHRITHANQLIQEQLALAAAAKKKQSGISLSVYERPIAGQFKLAFKELEAITRMAHAIKPFPAMKALPDLNAAVNAIITSLTAAKTELPELDAQFKESKPDFLKEIETLDRAAAFDRLDWMRNPSSAPTGGDEAILSEDALLETLDAATATVAVLKSRFDVKDPQADTVRKLRFLVEEAVRLLGQKVHGKFPEAATFLDAFDALLAAAGGGEKHEMVYSGLAAMRTTVDKLKAYRP